TLPYALGYAVHARAQLCDWTDYDASIERMANAVRQGVRACDPFTLLCYTDDPVAHLACARQFVDSNFPSAPLHGPKRPSRPQDRIRLAYLSADFHEHATSYLIAELFELHDRARF